MLPPEKRRLVCAAVLFENGHLLVGPRHYDRVMRDQIETYGGYDKFKAMREKQQGFIDIYGEFLNRHEAWTRAEGLGQIIERRDQTPGTLYSEDLY